MAGSDVLPCQLVIAMPEPLVSIAMPVRNCEETVALAIRSLLMQTYENWECLILDDGSTDRTAKIARSFSDPRIRILADGQHKGLPARLNEAVGECGGEYLARMDGDDISYPYRLERQLSFLIENDHVDLAGARMLVFGRGGAPLGKRGKQLESGGMRYLIQSIPLGHPTFMGKVSWFQRYKYSSWPKHFQDQHLLLKAYGKCKLAVIPEILLGYREETMTIAKQLKYRSSYLLSVGKLAEEIGVSRAIVIGLSQSLKLGLDVFALFSGMKYKILRHRARPISQEERMEWERVWNTVNQDTNQ